MAYKLAYSNRALETLTNIENYLMERSVSGARNVLNEIKHTAEILTNFPLIGTEISQREIRFQITRKYKYRLVYRVTDNAIQIMQIYHPRQESLEG